MIRAAIAAAAAAASLLLAVPASAGTRAVIGFSGAGTIGIGTSGNWCLAVRGARNTTPQEGLLVYVIRCGTAGYEQNWSVTQVVRPANNDLVGEISPLNNLNLCLGISETTSNVALQGCSDTDINGWPLRFVPFGRNRGLLDLWVIQRIDKTVISTKIPITGGKAMQWFKPNSNLAQVLQLPPLSEVQAI